ncbi:MAG: bifunctional riboflavin kinase/FAD synthetase [Eubacteriales bacterium]|nr:bifunctional riboflavin kinase/FAD synthetase [Eubacteriales bacterium]
MQIISGTEQFELEQPSAVAIGKFDGMHRGHKALLSQILEAKSDGFSAVVFTFEPSPAAFFSGKPVKGLTTRDEKRRLFRQMGIDVLVEFPLNERTAAILPETFVRDILCGRMKARLVAAGADLSFGDRGTGDAALLQRLSGECGYRVRVIDKVMQDGEEISSTRVRRAVEAGRMEEATALLGDPYAVMGTVAHGRRIGRTIGFPTVNLMPPKDKLLPPNGVYRSQVECRMGVFESITNVGTKPTVEHGEHPPMSVETYLYGFNGDMYDSFITVRLLSFLRPERKFSGLDELKEQLQRDIREAFGDVNLNHTSDGKHS